MTDSLFLISVSMKKRLLKTALAFVAAFLLMTAFLVIGSIFPSFAVCPVRRFLHFSCPGCGMTSAVLALLKLDFRSAFENNMIFVPILAYICYVAIPFAVKYVKTGEKRLYPKPEWLSVAFLAALIVWTVVRNIFHV